MKCLHSPPPPPTHTHTHANVFLLLRHKQGTIFGGTDWKWTIRLKVWNLHSLCISLTPPPSPHSCPLFQIEGHPLPLPPPLSPLPSPHPPSAACSSNRLLLVILASCFVSFPHVCFYGHKETRLYSLCYRTNWPNPWTANHLIKISTSLHNTPHDMVSR